MSGEPPKKPDTPKPVILRALAIEKKDLRNIHRKHYEQISQALQPPPPPKPTVPKESTISERPPPPKPPQAVIEAARIQHLRTVQKEKKELIEQLKKTM
jgi:hypothetical protein